MYNATDDVIAAFKADGVHKEFRVTLNGVNYFNEHLVADTLNLKQSILEGENFEAVGCIASSFSIDIRAQFPTKQRGAHVQFAIKANGTGGTWIQVFDGYVDKCTKTANGWNRHIECYDILYNMSGQAGQDNGNDQKLYDVTTWFNEHSDCTSEQLLRDLCSKYSIQIRNGNRALACGGVVTTCGKVKNASSLSALDLLKAIMQLNGCFGYITGDGYFSWKYLVMHAYDENGILYPSDFLYPSATLYPGEDPDQIQTKENATNFIGEYERLEYQDFKMLSIERVVVRNYEKDEDFGSYGDGTNRYIVEGNILIKDADKAKKDIVAKYLYDVISSNWYTPFNADLPGLPYIECGDEINFWDFIEDYGHANIQRFYVMTRTMTGGQHLKDNWSAEGNEYQHEFITTGDTGNIDDLRDEIEKKPDEDEVKDMIDNAKGLTNIVSVQSYSDIPDPPAQYTLYCVQSITNDIPYNDDNQGE